MEETLIISTVLEKWTRQIFADVFFLRRNHVKTIGRTVHAYFSSYNYCAIHNHSTQKVFFSRHKRFTRIPELLSRSNFVERGNYQLLSYIRKNLSRKKTQLQGITFTSVHNWILTSSVIIPTPLPTHTHTPHLPFKVSFYYRPSIHVYPSQMVPRFRLFN
jgi:phosphorylcholine metabolism protein LicD